MLTAAVLLSAILTRAALPLDAMTKPAPTLLDRLTSATRGLEFMSETDAPLEPFFVEISLRSTLTGVARRIAKRGTRTPIREIDFDDFFEPLTTPHEWDGPKERAAIDRYRRLQAMLKLYLWDLRVYRLGEVDVDIVVVGRTSEGDAAGFHTRALET